MKEVIQVYTDVKGYSVKGGNLLLYFSNRHLYWNNTLITDDLPGSDYELYTDVLFYVKKGGSTYVYDLRDGSQRFINKRYLWRSYVDGIGLFLDNEEYVTIRVTDGQEISRTVFPKGVERMCFSDYIFQTTFKNEKKEILQCFDRTTGEYQWEYDARKEGAYQDFSRRDSIHSGEIHRILGRYEDIVVVAVTGEHLMAFDVRTGNKRWQIDSVTGAIPLYLQNNPRLPSASEFKLDPITGVLTSFYQGIYIEIDARTGTAIKVLNDYTHLTDTRMELVHSNWYKEGPYIYYFTDGFRKRLPQLIAYDTDQAKVVWTHIFEGKSQIESYDRYALTKMIYDRGLFYVWDINHVLTVLKN
ncbi:PQQ-binding-like beta-propeller repeat protein [Xanthocytophaga agilis]|uniref:PQQ-binding-like beta-propeller repeat protein n=1 Tax=Xanthocytophaga agilis TaxID=3048010 RepID=A0AAE3QZX4_9BACT|nr:PQQ-binding-like beta-propeller repeat protein [Xanthocytophaga agilis]MDJ1501206.1 PQQ-binding-like beta-propeller repeat protein [Xanthocytophaga agilis]